MKAQLNISKLTIGYDANNPILSTIDLTASAGKMIGVLGRNGQGKSTFMKNNYFIFIMISISFK